MLRLSDLLRHSLYETQKPAVPLVSEIVILKSYIELESIRLEDNLQLQHEDTVPPDDPHLIAPLILIVFIENAFKHAKRVQSEPVYISVNTSIVNNWFQLRVQNNYKPEKKSTPHGIGLTNVIRRLEVLYPDSKHQLRITNDNNLFTVDLGIQLIPKN